MLDNIRIEPIESPVLGSLIKDPTILSFSYAAGAISLLLYVGPISIVAALISIAGTAALGIKDVQQTAASSNEGGMFRLIPESAYDDIEVKAEEVLPISREDDSVRTDWEEVFARITNQAEFPSLFIYGRQGTGKTTLVNYLLSLIPNRKVVLDPHYRYGAWGGCEVIGKGQNYAEIDSFIVDCLNDIQARYSLYASTPGYTPDLVTVVCEELTNWAEHIKKGKEFTKASLSDFRKAGYQAINVAHSDTNTARGGATGTRKMRDNGEVKIQLLAKGKALVSIPDEATFELRFPDLSQIEKPIQLAQSEISEQRERLESIIQVNSSTQPLQPSYEPALIQNASILSSQIIGFLDRKNKRSETKGRLTADFYWLQDVFKLNVPANKKQGLQTLDRLLEVANDMGFLTVSSHGNSKRISKPEMRLFQ